MRNSLYIAAAALAFTASPALAQDATGTVDVTGSVAGRCLFTTDNADIALGELALAGTDTNAGKLNAAVVNAGTATLVGWCNNAAATMEVSATKLTTPATAATGFTNSIDYTATAVANNVEATDTTTTELGGATADVGMFTGNIAVSLSNAAATGLLVAGDYSSTVTVTLSPAFTPPA